MPTNKEVMAKGVVIDDYACDVGADGELQSNGSIDVLLSYNGHTYSVICDWHMQPRWPDEEADRVFDDED